MGALIVYFIAALAYTIFWLKSGAITYSMSYYDLPDKWKGLFTLFCWVLGITGIMIFQTPLMIIGAICIMIVGIASDFVVKKVYEYVMDDGSVVLKEKRIKGIVYWMHMLGTYFGVGFNQASLWIEHGRWYLVVLFVVMSLGLLIWGKFRRLGWIELAAITTTFIAAIWIYI